MVRKALNCTHLLLTYLTMRMQPFAEVRNDH
jgi:hypothetical protein